MFSKFTVLSAVFLALTGFTVAVALVFRNPLLVYTAVFLVVTNVTLFVWAQLSVGGMSIKRHHPRLAVAARRLDIRLELTNHRTNTRYGTLGFDLHQQITPSQDYSPVAFLEAPSGTAVAASYETVPARRGVFRLGPFYLYGGDPFGFYKCWARKEEYSELIVLPSPVPFRFTRPASVSRLAQDEMETVPTSGESTEFLGVREYAAGESLRRVHWPSTARLGKLISRQYELNVAAAVSALLLATPEMLSGTPVDNPLEYSLRMVAGLGQATTQERFQLSFLGLLGQQHLSLSGTGRRFYQELAILLARLEGQGPLNWDSQARLILNYLPAGSSLVVFTTEMEDETRLRLQRLGTHFRQVGVICFERRSFERARRPDTPGPRLQLQEGLMVCEVSFGDDLTTALELVFSAAGMLRSRR